MNLINCCVCHEIFNDPRSLSCGHTFCYKCILSFCKSECPICRKVFLLSVGKSHPPNYVVCDIVDNEIRTAYEVPKQCTECNNQASYWCGDCKPPSVFCKLCCKKVHQYCSSTSHNIIPMIDKIRHLLSIIIDDETRRRNSIIGDEQRAYQWLESMQLTNLELNYISRELHESNDETSGDEREIITGEPNLVEQHEPDFTVITSRENDDETSDDENYNYIAPHEIQFHENIIEYAFDSTISHTSMILTSLNIAKYGTNIMGSGIFFDPNCAKYSTTSRVMNMYGLESCICNTLCSSNMCFPLEL